MNYLHTILTRSDNEVTKRVLIAQKESPTKGDFFNLVQEDYNKIGEILDMQQIENTSKERHKRYVKSKISISYTLCNVIPCVATCAPKTTLLQH